MQDNDPLYQHVRQVMLEIMTVLYANGLTTLHVGAAMRLLGVPDEAAQAYDNEHLDLAENLDELIKNLSANSTIIETVPAGATVH